MPAQHTTGPWRDEAPTHPGCDAHRIARVVVADRPGSPVLAYVTTDAAASREEALANARVMAASAGLLAAVEAIFTPDAFARYDGLPPACDQLTMTLRLSRAEFDAIRSALARARGEE